MAKRRKSTSKLIDKRKTRTIKMTKEEMTIAALQQKNEELGDLLLRTQAERDTLFQQCRELMEVNQRALEHFYSRMENIEIE